MNLLQALVLGAVQGLTEFLPVSSDGHLAVAYRLLGLNSGRVLPFEVLLHVGTLLAVIVYFRKDLLKMITALFSRDLLDKPYRRIDLLVLVGTIATLPIVFGLKDVVEPFARNMTVVGVMFLITAGVLAGAEWLSRGKANEHINDAAWWKAIPIGLGQGFAVLPAISRSGNTIAVGLLVGLKREEAARFSFLLGVPIIALAFVKDGYDVLKGGGGLPSVAACVVGVATAAVVGYVAVAWLLALVKQHTLYGFAMYTALVGTALLVATLAFKVF